MKVALPRPPRAQLDLHSIERPLDGYPSAGSWYGSEKSGFQFRFHPHWGMDPKPIPKSDISFRQDLQITESREAVVRIRLLSFVLTEGGTGC